MKIRIFLGLFFCAATAVLAQTTEISNLNQPNAGYTGVDSDDQEANSFTTGATNAWLSGVSVSLVGSRSGIQPANNPPGAFKVSIYNDAGGSPGSVLATLFGNNYPANAGLYSYTNASGVELSSNATYWVVASSIDSTNGASYLWRVTNSTNLDSGSVWKLGGSEFGSGSGWQQYFGNYTFQFSAAIGSPPPPPSLSISQPIVLTWTNVGFSFVLQQNSSVATTNWGTVTNAILSGVISNQSVFIVPQNGGQKFYRLNLP
jgi:hypothetical protein